jgi:hypothetical protein
MFGINEIWLLVLGKQCQLIWIYTYRTCHQTHMYGVQGYVY